MLKKRIPTALVLISGAITAIFYLPLPLFIYLVGMITLWGAFEFSSLIGLQKNYWRYTYVVLVAILLALTTLYAPVYTVLSAGIAWWVISVLLMISFPASQFLWGNHKLIKSLIGIFMLIPAWLAISIIRSHPNGNAWIMALLLYIWGTDIGAYFYGSWFGKKKLLPKISPNKTWKGFLGGLLVTMLIIVILCSASPLSLNAWPKMLCLGLSASLFSTLGDLIESMLKRNAGVKDTGNFLPGHGGLLDRIDSLLSAAPIFAVLLFLFKL